MAFAYCPECLARLEIKRQPRVGQLVACSCCSTSLRVADPNPLQLDWVVEVAGEGWGEEWEVELEPV